MPGRFEPESVEELKRSESGGFPSDAQRLAAWLSVDVDLGFGATAIGTGHECGLPELVYVLVSTQEGPLLWIIPAADFDRIDDFSPLDLHQPVAVGRAWKRALLRLLPAAKPPGPGWRPHLSQGDQRIRPIGDDRVEDVSSAARVFQALRAEAPDLCRAIVSGEVMAAPLGAWRLDPEGEEIEFRKPWLAGAPRRALAVALVMVAVLFVGGWDSIVDRDGDGHRALWAWGDDCWDGPKGRPGMNSENVEIQVEAGKIFPFQVERCNGIADDCDEKDGVDVQDSLYTGNVSIWYVDGDADGHGRPPKEGETLELVCNRKLVKPGFVLDDPSDCDDSTSANSPDAEEIVDQKDNDCDGQVDEGLGEAALKGVTPEQAAGAARNAERIKTELERMDAIKAGAAEDKKPEVKETLTQVGSWSPEPPPNPEPPEPQEENPSKETVQNPCQDKMVSVSLKDMLKKKEKVQLLPAFVKVDQRTGITGISLYTDVTPQDHARSSIHPRDAEELNQIQLRVHGTKLGAGPKAVKVTVNPDPPSDKKQPRVCEYTWTEQCTLKFESCSAVDKSTP